MKNSEYYNKNSTMCYGKLINMYHELISEMLGRLETEKKVCNELISQNSHDKSIEEINRIEELLFEYGDEVRNELKIIQELERFYKDKNLLRINQNIAIDIQQKIDLIIERIKKNVKSTYDRLAFATMVKNEASYIKEWIEYHKLVGVTKFYIYDHGSEDNLFEVLAEYIDRGEVTYTKWPDEKFHVSCFNAAFQSHKYSSKYMGFIDCDEFVVPVKKSSIIEVMDDLMKRDSHCGGLGVNWVLYGTSGHEVKPNGLVSENYTMRMEPGYCKEIKTILDPRRVVGFTHMHYANYKEGYYAVNEKGEKIEGAFNYNFSIDEIRINHYYTKSKEEFLQKSKRGRGDNGLPIDMHYFYSNNRNEVYDPIMIPYVEKIKIKLNKSR